MGYVRRQYTHTRYADAVRRRGTQTWYADVVRRRGVRRRGVMHVMYTCPAIGCVVMRGGTDDSSEGGGGCFNCWGAAALTVGGR